MIVGDSLWSTPTVLPTKCSCFHGSWVQKGWKSSHPISHVSCSHILFTVRTPCGKVFKFFFLQNTGRLFVQDSQPVTEKRHVLAPHTQPWQTMLEGQLLPSPACASITCWNAQHLPEPWQGQTGDAFIRQSLGRIVLPTPSCCILHRPKFSQCLSGLGPPIHGHHLTVPHLLSPCPSPSPSPAVQLLSPCMVRALGTFPTSILI